MEYHSLSRYEPGKGGGKLCIRGLRITVSDELEYLASGMSELMDAARCASFPSLVTGS